MIGELALVVLAKDCVSSFIGYNWWKRRAATGRLRSWRTEPRIPFVHRFVSDANRDVNVLDKITDRTVFAVRRLVGTETFRLAVRKFVNSRRKWVLKKGGVA